LYRWSQSEETSAPAFAASGFAEVRVLGADAGASFEVTHPIGCVVRVCGSVDEAQLVAVLRALSAC